MSEERKKEYPPEVVQKVKELKKEGVKPKDIAAEIPMLELGDVMAILLKKVKAEVAPKPAEEKPVEEEVVEVLPNIFVVDHSVPFGSLTAARVLVHLEENKCYPMNESVNEWTRLNNVPIKAPSKNLQKTVEKLEGVGIPNSLKLGYLREKLKKIS